MCSRFQCRAIIEYVLLCFQTLSNIYLPAFTHFSMLSGSGFYCFAWGLLVTCREVDAIGAPQMLLEVEPVLMGYVQFLQQFKDLRRDKMLVFSYRSYDNPVICVSPEWLSMLVFLRLPYI